MILDIFTHSCPLILAATGALFSELSGLLALFLDGLISFAAFLCFLFTTKTSSVTLGFILSTLICTFLVFILSFIIKKTKANPFIASIAMNLLFSSLVSLFSNIFFNTRGVLFDSNFVFIPKTLSFPTISITTVLVIGSLLFLNFTQKGTYFKIVGSNPDVLTARGINVSNYEIAAWCIAAFFGAMAGCFLPLRISSFVPNISSGRGWMALAIVFFGRKKILRITFAVIIFCGTDYFATHIQNYIPNIPSSFILSLPYLLIILLMAIDKKRD